MRCPVALALAVTLLPACCVNPFIGTDTHLPADAPGSPERETQGGSLEEHAPALQTGTTSEETPGAFDMRLVRVQPGVHLDTEQLCDVAAVGRLEPIAATDDEDDHHRPSRYAEDAVQRLSVQCASPTGSSWVDLSFASTHVSRAAEVQPGVRIRVRIRSADGGFFDYPIVEFVRIEGRAPEPAGETRTPGPPTVVPVGFDLRQLHTDPGLVGSSQLCAVSHVGEIGILDAADVRRRSYPAGVQNRMTVRCHHAGGEEWADLVFMPAQARSALHVRRGSLVPVTIIARNGGFFDYPVLQYAGD
jgi:hypothetical protein